MNSPIKDQARGAWTYILPRIGIPSDCLINKHQPCPMCGGKDRFRFDDLDGNGTFYCNHCGAGDGVKFVMLWLQCDFREAVNAIEEVLHIGQSSHHSTRTPPQSTPKAQTDQLDKLTTIWEKANTDIAPLLPYFHQRGLSLDAMPNVRLCSLPYWTQLSSGEWAKLGEYIAMIAPITNSAGELLGLHRTFLQGRRKARIHHPETGELLDAKKMLSRYHRSTYGGAIRLINQGDTLIVAEGIETALAARELFSEWGECCIWACMNAHGLENVDLDGVNRLIIVADHDAAGLTAGQRLLIRAKNQGIAAALWYPDEYGTDANDYLQNGAER